MLLNILPVMAYIDPGVGSILLQALAGIIMGVIVFFGLIKSKLMGLFGKKAKNADGEEDEQE